MPSYFTLPELCVTGQQIDNIPDWGQVESLRLLTVQLLNPIRELVKRVVHVNSAFRCPAVNTAIGGAKDSQHMCLGPWAAADLTVGSIADNKQLFDMIIKSGLTFDQVWLEKGGLWVHASLSSVKNRQQSGSLP